MRQREVTLKHLNRCSYQQSKVAFLRESLAIEGIHRRPTKAEISGTEAFLDGPLTLCAVIALQAVYAPGKPLRDRPGMDVRVGKYHPPCGSANMRKSLDTVLAVSDPYESHIKFEKLHPFLDGNGRTGRAVWAWRMLALGRDPFVLSFLHRWYYETLTHG